MLFITNKYLLSFVSLTILAVLLLFYNDDSKLSKVRILCENLSSSNADFKVHVSYVHHIDTDKPNIMENFRFFMNFGVHPCDPRVDYRIILNTNNINANINDKLAKVLADDELMSEIESCSNVVIIKNKNNKDLCAHSDQLKTEAWKSDKLKYKYFFFINSTPRGPFLPNYWTEPWWTVFTNKFSSNPKLVGTGPYLSTEYHPHIQSFFVVVDSRGLDLLEAIWRCPVEEPEFHWITNTELVRFNFFLFKIF